MNMKSLSLFFLLTLCGCYVSNVGIRLDADNASELNITAHSPTDDPNLRIRCSGGGLRILKTPNTY